MYKEVCMLDWCDVRHLCIEHQWYTCGTNAEYSRLQKYVWDNHELPSEKYADILQHIAEDISTHSETEYTVRDIMNCLAAACFRYFYKA